MFQNLNTALWICNLESQSNALVHNTWIKKKEENDGRGALSFFLICKKHTV